MYQAVSKPITAHGISGSKPAHVSVHGGRVLQDARQSNQKNIQLKRTPLKHQSFSTSQVVQRVVGEGQKPGTEIMEISSGMVFIILAIGPGSYRIKPMAVEGAERSITAEDPNYKIFREEPEPVAKVEEKGTPASSGIGAMFSKLIGKAPAPPAPGVSGAYRVARMEQVMAEWPALKTKAHEVTVRAESIIQAESSPHVNHHDDPVLYSAAGLGSYTLHQIIKTIYEAYHQVRVKDFEFLRALGNTPRPETSQGPQAFLASRKKGAWSDHSERESMMSTNIALMANVEDSSESTFSILASGGLFDIDPVKTVEIIKKMLAYLGMPPSFAEAILEEVRTLAVIMDKIKNSSSSFSSAPAKKEAVVYQIIIPKKLVSRLVYIASKNGHPLDSSSSFVNPEIMLSAIVEAGKQLKNGGMAAWAHEKLSIFESLPPEGKSALLQGTEFTMYALEAAKSPAFWAAFTGRRADPQARLLMHPNVFEKPSGLVKIITHKNLSEGTEGTLSTGLSRIGTITAYQQNRLAIIRIGEMIAYYGVLRGIGLHPSELALLPFDRLREIQTDLYARVRAAEEYIQVHITDVIATSERLQEIIKSPIGLPVTVGGKLEKLDIDTPIRMSMTELEALSALLQKEKTAPVPDLLTFD